jgi:hypothetical protein
MEPRRGRASPSEDGAGLDRLDSTASTEKEKMCDLKSVGNTSGMGEDEWCVCLAEEDEEERDRVEAE